MNKFQIDQNQYHTADTGQAQNPMTQEEIHTLEGWERVIEKNLSAFYEVGSALLAIRDYRLYRSHFATFEDYCRERWDMGRHNAYRQINAAEVMTKLLTMVNIQLPKSERQVRSLVGLEPDLTKSIWQRCKNPVRVSGG